ncbi:AI-2E family transporter, partial [Thermus scotoductus]|uniref:AI-2E family transporter n=1 Tax=Thermus scotoductus TaxID=37636 RepID=UPI0020A4E38F
PPHIPPHALVQLMGQLGHQGLVGFREHPQGRLGQAASLGFLAGVFNLIPFVGVIVSGVPALLLAATGGWGKVLLALLVLWLANQLEGNLLGPLIVGRSTRLHPVTAIAAILVGATLFGLWGALLGVPTAAFLKVLLEEYYKKSRFYREG